VSRYDGRTSLNDRGHRHFCQTPTCENHYICTQRDGCDNEKWTCPPCEWIERDAHAEALMVELNATPKETT
jgi:hypothetical protein